MLLLFLLLLLFLVSGSSLVGVVPGALSSSGSSGAWGCGDVGVTRRWEGGLRNAFTFVFSLLFYVCFFLSLRCFFAHLPGPVVIGSEKFQVFFKVLVRWGPIQASKQTKRTILQLTHTHTTYTHTHNIYTHNIHTHAQIHCIGTHTQKK